MQPNAVNFNLERSMDWGIYLARASQARIGLALKKEMAEWGLVQTEVGRSLCKEA